MPTEITTRAAPTTNPATTAAAWAASHLADLNAHGIEVDCSYRGVPVLALASGFTRSSDRGIESWQAAITVTFDGLTFTGTYRWVFMSDGATPRIDLGYMAEGGWCRDRERGIDRTYPAAGDPAEDAIRVTTTMTSRAGAERTYHGLVDALRLGVGALVPEPTWHHSGRWGQHAAYPGRDA